MIILFKSKSTVLTLAKSILHTLLIVHTIQKLSCPRKPYARSYAAFLRDYVARRRAPLVLMIST